MHNDKRRIAKDKSLPKSIRSVVRMYPSNQVNRLFYGGLPHLGNALWGSWNSHDIQKASEAYEDYSLSTKLLIKGCKPPTVDKVRLGGGSPARFKPFQPCLTQIKQTLENRILSDYPMASGDEISKVSIIKYFKDNYSKELGKNNIIFAHSSTQAFALVMEAILDYGDVVIMTAPNYGLFSFMPERVGGKVRLLELTALDNWKINPSKLKKLINEINNELRLDYDNNRGKYIFRRSDTSPKVSAFVNLNPHNPTGVVYGKKDKSLLLEISNICKDAGVFIVDDLAYSGLEYDRNNTALPICSRKGHFDNTITLYTLSKSYGLAGLRSGMVISNEIVSSLIRDRIFQTFDSLSLLQSSAMSGAFSTDKKIAGERNEYFSYITKEYYERYVFVKSIIEGFDALKESEKTLLKKTIKKNKLKLEINKTMDGIKDVKIVMEPESGFFMLLDLSELIGKSYKGFTIVDERTLLQFLYTSGNIKVLTGKAFCWANCNQLIIRVTTALDYKLLLSSFLRFKMSIESVK